jgi:hypothetical protein
VFPEGVSVLLINEKSPKTRTHNAHSPSSILGTVKPLFGYSFLAFVKLEPRGVNASKAASGEVVFESLLVFLRP